METSFLWGLGEVIGLLQDIKKRADFKIKTGYLKKVIKGYKIEQKL